MKSVRLKAGREKPVQHGHPWIFSGAVEGGSADLSPGDVVDVLDQSGGWIARGFVHPESNLSVRVFTRDQDEALDADLLRRRVASAVALRKSLFKDRADTDSYRLVFSESDGLSGLIVDRYASTLSIRLSARALVPHLPAILDELTKSTGLHAFHIAVEKDAEEREGLTTEMLPPVAPIGDAPVTIRENGALFDVDVAGGQKTGYYLDQRENRRRVASFADGRRVLSAYCYTGAFEVLAARAGASEITGLDVSKDALARAEQHMAKNGIATPYTYKDADVPEALRRFRDSRQTFDMIILDPPRFVVNKSQVEKGLRAYKDIQLLAIKLLTPGGILATFSCSGLIHRDDLMRSLAWAAEDSRKTVRVIESLHQPGDHPILAAFPESEYLCGLIAHVDT